jgi:hypothetical protein
MNILKKLLICSATIIVFQACNNEGNKKIASTSVGYASELNITTDLETYNYLKEGISLNVASPQDYLSPAEPFYRINFIGIKGFEGSYLEYMLQLFVITDENKSEMKHLSYGIGKKLFDSITSTKQVSFSKVQNVWAKNQSLFFVYGPTKEAVRLYLRDNSETVRTAMYNAEIIDFGNRVGSYSHPFSTLLKNKFNIEMAFPPFMEMDIDKDSFLAANWTEGDGNCNILISVLDSTTDPSSKESMLAARKIQGKRFLPMDSTGALFLGTSNMITQQHQSYTLNGYKGAKINGWWVIEGQFRGGPYTRYTIYHKPSKQWISVEGLVYYPNLQDKKDGKSKTRYLRTLESIISTLK